jgi:SAM-dependent methyltransferase
MTKDDEAAEMFAYYEARADGNDDFYRGKGAAIPELASEYPLDTAGVASMLAPLGRGDVVDLACGTGFWLNAYGTGCRSVTLVDQSAAVLARCRRRVDARGIARPLPDGHCFVIRKKYYDRPELESLLARYGFQLESAYVGNVFIGALSRRLD